MRQSYGKKSDLIGLIVPVITAPNWEAGLEGIRLFVGYLTYIDLSHCWRDM